MYCLEVSKEVMKTDNLGELKIIHGDVRVLYADGTERVSSFSELYTGGKIIIIPHDSYEFMQIYFIDESIVQITVGNEGIGLFRDDMTEYEIALSNRNIERIHELEALGIPHTQIQSILWRTKVPIVIQDSQGRILIDYRTTDDENEKVLSNYDSSATVSYQRGGQTFLRVDGLIDKSTSIFENITELVTHKHDDHFKTAIAAQVLQEGSFQRIIVPNPIQEASRNDIYNLLNKQNVNISVNKQLMDIIPLNGTPLDLNFTSIGDFIHSEFTVNGDVTVEVFKYLNSRKNINNDGLIFQITHKGVTQLLFGDMDNIKAIENLLDASMANELQRNEIDKKLSKLLLQYIQTENEYNINYYYLNIYLPEQSSINEYDKNTKIELQKIINRQQQLLKILDQTGESIIKLRKERNNLPVLRADVIKWMHHAHVFSETRALDIITKLHDVVEPQYIIWQRYNNQSDIKFEDFIKQFPFGNKCLSSGERDIIIISLEWLINRQINLYSYNILNALRGAPAALAEGNVSVRSMSGFVSLEVPKITDNRQNPKVYSLLFADFPLTAVR